MVGSASVQSRFAISVIGCLLQFSLDDCSATVGIGHTKVMTVVSATLGAPYEDRWGPSYLVQNRLHLAITAPHVRPAVLLL